MTAPGAILMVRVVTDTSEVSSGLKKTASDSKTFGSTFKGAFAAISSSAAVSQVYSFGKASVEAFQKAQQGTVEFNHAMEQVPGATEGTAASLAAYAKQLSRTTEYSGGQTKAGMAVLANFKLTAGQIKTLTPLMQDYATRTGKNLPEAATTLGKALLGQAKALKAVGITLPAASSGTKAAARAAGAYEASTKALMAAQDHLKVVQGEVSSGQLTGKSAASALASAHARVAERTMAAGRAHVAMAAAQRNAGKGTSNFTALVGALQGKVGGLSTSMGQTAAGRMKIMSNQFNALKVTVGAQLVPVLTKLGGILMRVVTFIQNNITWIRPLVVMVLSFVAAIKIATIAMAAFDAVSNANPFVLIIAGIVALVALLVLAYQKVGWFRAGVDAMGRAARVAFNAVKTAATVVFNWIRTNWPLLIAILTGPLGVAILLIVKNWNTIKAVFAAGVAAVRSVFSAVVSFFAGLPGKIGGALAGVFHAIMSPFQAAWNWISSNVFGPIRNAFNGLAGAIGDAMSGVFNAIIGPFESAWNWIRNNMLGPLKSAWNGVANTLNSVHLSFSIGAKKLAGHTVIPALNFDWRPPWHIPTLDRGGIVRSPTLALLAANSRPEAVIPLGSAAKPGGGDTHIHLHVPATANPAEVGRQTVKMLQAYVRAQGPGSLANALGMVAAP